MPGNEQTQPEEIAVDTAAIRRKSVLEGAWSGVKAGLLWGGAGTAVLSIGAAFIGLPMVANTAKGIGGFVFNIPYIGKPLALVATAIGVGAAAKVGGGGIAGIAWQLLHAAGSAFLTVGIPILATAALIGGLVGAVKGYYASDEQVKMAESQARRQAMQAKADLAQSRQQQQELAQVQQEFNQQTNDLNAQSGQFSPGVTPKSLENNNLGSNVTPQVGK